MPQVLRTDSTPEIDGGSGRMELARWIASPDNPLTARVWANRVWLHMFGRGLVATPDNFGASGQAPTHPELLDWLASELIASDWSTKALVREIALSRAYRLSARGSSSMESRDPDLASYWRMPSRRLEAEAIRDAMLSAAGVLEAEPPVGSPAGDARGDAPSREPRGVRHPRVERALGVHAGAARARHRRHDAFDAPDAASVTGAREVTTGATQALFLMNDSHVLRTADAFADRLLAMDGDENDRIETAFELALGREPDTGERRLVRGFLDDYRNAFAKEAPTASRRAFQRGRSQRRGGSGSASERSTRTPSPRTPTPSGPPGRPSPSPSSRARSSARSTDRTQTDRAMSQHDRSKPLRATRAMRSASPPPASGSSPSVG